MSVSSRSPTPSPPVELLESSSEFTVRSKSPGRSPSPSAKPSKMNGGYGRNTCPATTISQRPLNPTSNSAPAGKIPRLPLQDVSQYTDSYIYSSAVTASSTTLAELAHLVRLQAYQEQKRSHSRVRLHRCLVASALSARLARCGELAHRTLVDSFRSDEKKNFAQLYNALHDVRNSCDATRRYALLEPDLDFEKSKAPRHEKARAFSTFMHELPTKTRDELLKFIVKIRTNPDFLAGRISSLSQAELASLTAFHQSSAPVESVISSQPRGKVSAIQQNRSSAHVPTPVERLLSLHRHDPLSALLYTIFANSTGPDSAEDLRRTEVWSATCARIITEAKSGSEQFTSTVLSAWAAMREWPAKGNLELYLMRLLQDGAFLLERAEEQSTGIKPQAEQRNSKNEIAAEEFYEMAVKRLFEVLDDEPSAGGIPEGVLELGNAIIRKIEDPKKQRTAETFIVAKWFFSKFLTNAIINPEASIPYNSGNVIPANSLFQYHGIMTGHHISEYARHKILKEVVSQASKHVLDLTYNWKQAAPILPQIRTHIESILSRFRCSRPADSKPVLLPAKVITSPRETVEVQPFILVCPSDIITLANTLFPDRRPHSSSTERDTQRKTLRSVSSSLSGLSLPIQTKPQARGGADSASFISNSSSSMTSDTTSREPLLDRTDLSGEGNFSSNSYGSQDTQQNEQKATTMEEYGKKLKWEVSEMTRALGGSESTAGSCHPCAERWAVLYVSADGKDLMTRMRKDWDDEDDDDEDSPESDSEDEGHDDKSDLGREYHQLKESIVKLVEEYEIPKELAPESESKEFSNRTSTIRKQLKHNYSGKTVPSLIPENSVSLNPYRSQSQLSAMLADQRIAVPERHRQLQARSNNLRDLKQQQQHNEPPSVLLTMLEAAMNQCISRSDFVSAHLYHKTLQQLHKLSSPSLRSNGYGPLLNIFSRGSRDSIGKSASAIEEFEAWFVWLTTSQERHDAAIEEMMLRLKDLRDKMWFVTDVKHSAAYEEAKNIAVALKTMGQPPKTAQGKPASTARPRNVSKSSTTNFLLKTETQIVDLMAAPMEQGGPNKLSDEQVEMTSKWLAQCGVESYFCKGEERIHRFCLAIYRCVNKLVGDGILDAPVLWSSELYNRDKRILDSGRQKGDLFLTSVGTLSIPGDEEYETETGRSGPRSLDFVGRPTAQDLRSISSKNRSQQSFAGTTDIMDSQDYFGMPSPVLTIDSSATFWSPFQTQAQSPTGTSNIRPRTASASNDTVMLKNSESVNQDKRRFLLDLKQTLTGLLLSDLGNLVWSRGSETDTWFSGDLGEECLQRKEALDRKRKRALMKKKSMRSLRGGRIEHRSGPLETLGKAEKGQIAAPIATLEHAAPDFHSAEENSSSSDATARSSGLSAAKRAGLLEFPYNTAFRRLLHKFSTHPNPFTKLHALYELELLIVASLSSRSGRSFGNRRDTLPEVPTSPTLGAMEELAERTTSVQIPRAKNLEEAIANCEERRSHTIASGAPLRSPTGTRSPSGPPSTDMIVDVLQELFRNSDIRPKTLFRDLQFVASFVPAHVLDKTERGKAFWDAGLAALGLKQDVCRMMVEIADEVVGYHTKKRGESANASGKAEKGGPKRNDESEYAARFSMEDAARMWAITAKEGDPTAERELAIFYLTNPNLLSRVTQPLSRPKDTFTPDMMRQRNEDPSKRDPANMCVAYHWMDLSSQGGDDLAQKYLRSREEGWNS
ncbi:hypothetical protein FGG08_000601 [Glutinoglossum americanum]|uniref:Uncharacterized protein n=1 Tax=Glutinoglossum americanum TaxID=1670608 RepID=A0A9P8IG70_9PEZI|nr:hypothetical protein FGG08_000601 [Glutinoglossum americanum]